MATGSEISQTLRRPSKTHLQAGFHPLAGNLICVSVEDRQGQRSLSQEASERKVSLVTPLPARAPGSLSRPHQGSLPGPHHSPLPRPHFASPHTADSETAPATSPNLLSTKPFLTPEAFVYIIPPAWNAFILSLYLPQLLLVLLRCHFLWGAFHAPCSPSPARLSPLCSHHNTGL